MFLRWSNSHFINHMPNERGENSEGNYIFSENILTAKSVGAVHCGLSNTVGRANFQKPCVPQECEPSSNTSSFPVDAGSRTLGKSAVSPRLRARQHFQACSLLCPPIPSQLFPPALVRQPCFAHASACQGRLTERCCCRWDFLRGDSVRSSRASLQIRLSLQGTSALTAAPIPSVSDMLRA